MRVVVMANNWVGWQVTGWLRAEGAAVVGLVVHPPEQQKYGAEIIKAAGVPEQAILDGSRLHERDVLEKLATLKPDLGLSLLFGYLLKPEVIALFRRGIVNLHPSLLPYNRGRHPNVWSIVDRTPAGVSLHYIDEGVDTGDLIAQRRVPVEATDTGLTLYRRLEEASVRLFTDTWPSLVRGEAQRTPQPKAGSHRRLTDVKLIDEIDLGRSYRAGELLDIIRARTFPPYPGAYFVQDGRKIFVRLELSADEAGGSVDDDSEH